MKHPVKLFIRIGDNDEICVGSARTVADVPVLLERIAAHLRAGMAPDEYEPKTPKVNGSHVSPCLY